MTLRSRAGNSLSHSRTGSLPPALAKKRTNKTRSVGSTVGADSGGAPRSYQSWYEKQLKDEFLRAPKSPTNRRAATACRPPYRQKPRSSPAQLRASQSPNSVTRRMKLSLAGLTVSVRRSGVYCRADARPPTSKHGRAALGGRTAPYDAVAALGRAGEVGRPISTRCRLWSRRHVSGRF
jgi:hypothetical protein